MFGKLSQLVFGQTGCELAAMFAQVHSTNGKAKDALNVGVKSFIIIKFHHQFAHNNVCFDFTSLISITAATSQYDWMMDFALKLNPLCTRINYEFVWTAYWVQAFDQLFSRKCLSWFGTAFISTKQAHFHHKNQTAKITCENILSLFSMHRKSKQNVRSSAYHE